jgi:NADH-quinone oxidoreductase subunit B
MGLEAALPTDSVVTTQLNRVVNWARRSSVWPLPFATACCGIELMATACSRFDLARFGAEVMRFSPRQADLLIVAGRISVKTLPVLQRVYMQMAEPKWVISMGACASTGGVFDTYAVVQGVDQYIPVDVYVPGCPPRPEMLIEGIMAIQRIIDEDNVPRDPTGKRLPLNIALTPNYEVRPQPVPLGIQPLNRDVRGVVLPATRLVNRDGFAEQTQRCAETARAKCGRFHFGWIDTGQATRDRDWTGNARPAGRRRTRIGQAWRGAASDGRRSTRGKCTIFKQLVFPR